MFSSTVSSTLIILRISFFTLFALNFLLFLLVFSWVSERNLWACFDYLPPHLCIWLEVETLEFGGSAEVWSCDWTRVLFENPWLFQTNFWVFELSWDPFVFIQFWTFKFFYTRFFLLISQEHDNLSFPCLYAFICDESFFKRVFKLVIDSEFLLKGFNWLFAD